MNKLTFPQDFLWGSATAAHQVEGNNTNSDWWQWEHSAKRMSALRNKNKNPEDYFSGLACDSYNRYEEDFDLAKSLHQNAHRLSIEWARIEPFQGEFDREQIEHYRKVLRALRDRGIKTFVTLHHFTNPLWFAEKKAWEKSENIQYFIRYCEFVVRELGELMDAICIINEPNLLAAQGYLTGKFPPNKVNPFLYSRVRKNLISAYNQAYKKIKAIAPSIPAGPVLAVSYLRIRGANFLSSWLDSKVYTSFTESVIQYSDFLGWNYYWVHFFPPNSKYPRTDIGWYVYPPGFLNVLQYAKKFKKPVYITENGIADAQDKMRQGFIKDHLKILHQAISEGVDVRGYFYWSLIDNFEWDRSFSMRFGLIEIDHKNNLTRKIRPSALYYAEICKNNAMEP